ncbi:MAG: aldo/keto reductase [Candidatus Heimdallarchaeota archaeon]
MKRKFGRYGREVGALGLGCFAIGGPFKGKNGRYLAYGTVSDDESRKIIHKAIELGINAFDTADVYGCGHSERILGSVLSEYDRSDFVIATKFANQFDEQTKTVIQKNVDPEYIRNALDSSCERLQTDFIDVYQLHSSDHDIDDAKTLIPLLEDLVSEGRIGGYGWSTDDPERARVFAEGKNCIAMQYAIHVQRLNPKMTDLCEQHNLAGLIRSPLGSGTLTGKYTKDLKLPEDHMWHGASFWTEEERFIKRQAILENLKEFLMDDGRTMVQALLAYLWTTGDTTIPIPGAKTVAQIEENAGTLEYGPLQSELLKEINDLFEEIRILV